MSKVLHVEVARNPASLLKTADILHLLQESIGAHDNPVGDFCLHKARYSHLKEHINSVKFCSAGSTCRTVSSDSSDVGSKQFRKSACKQYEKLEYYIFKLNEEAEITEFIDDDDEDGQSHASYHCMLPSQAFYDLWDSLIMKSEIKAQLIEYIKTAVLYSEKMVNDSLISWNKVILLHGPPGNGKTSLCKALAHKATIRLGSRFDYGQLVEINSHSLFSKWFSESGKLILKMFEKIQELIDDPRSIVFLLIDEVESLAKNRLLLDSSRDPSDSIRAVNALLVQIDRIKKYPNVVILATSNMVGTVDIAFIDRADMKIFIGNPPAEAVYEILASSVNELIRVGIVKPEEDIFVPPTHRDISKSDASYAYAKQLVEVARAAVDLSGRLLRKIPFLAHIQYVKSDQCSLRDFLEWMLVTVRKEKEDLAAVNSKGFQSTDTQPEKISEVALTDVKGEAQGIKVCVEDSKQEIDETKPVISPYVRPRPGRPKKVDQTPLQSNHDAPRGNSSSTEILSDIKVGMSKPPKDLRRRRSVEEIDLTEYSSVKDGEVSVKRSDSVLLEPLAVGAVKRKPVFASGSKGMAKKNKVDDDEIRPCRRTRQRISTSTDSCASKKGIQLRSAKVVVNDIDEDSDKEVVETERQSSSLAVSKFKWKNEIFHLKECYVDLSKSICTPSDAAEYTKRRSSPKEDCNVRKATDEKNRESTLNEGNALKASRKSDENETPDIVVLSTPVPVTSETSAPLVVPTLTKTVQKSSQKSFGVLPSSSTADYDQSHGGNTTSGSSLPLVENSSPFHKSPKLTPIPLPSTFPLPKPIIMKIEPGPSRATESGEKPTESGPSTDGECNKAEAQREKINLVSANSVVVPASNSLHKDVNPVRPVQRVSGIAAKTGNSYSSASSDGTNISHKTTITPALKSIYPLKIANTEIFNKKEVKGLVQTNVSAVPAISYKNNSSLPVKPITGVTNTNSPVLKSTHTLVSSKLPPVPTKQKSPTTCAVSNQISEPALPDKVSAGQPRTYSKPGPLRSKMVSHGSSEAALRNSPVPNRCASPKKQAELQHPQPAYITNPVFVGNIVSKQPKRPPVRNNSNSKLPTTNGCRPSQSMPARGRKGRSWLCETCDISFYFKRELNAHRNEAHPALVHCSVCKKAISNLESLKRHENACKKKQKDQSEKPKVFISFGAEQPSELSYSQDSPGSLPDTRKIPNRTVRSRSPTPSPLHLLEKTLDSPSKRAKFSCTDCSEVFTNEKDLKKHDICHQDERPYGCSQCTKTFKRESSRNFHIKFHHSGSPEESYACTVCGMICTSEAEVANHENNVHFIQNTPSFDVPETPLSQATTESSSVSPANNSDCDQSMSFCGTPFSDNANDCLVSNHSTDHFRGIGNSGSGHIEPVDFQLGYQNCNICGECFLHDFELTQHQQSFHQPPTPTPVQPTSNNNEYFLQDNIPVPDVETVIEVETTDEFLTFLSAF